NKLVDLIVLKLGDGIFKYKFLGQHAHRKAQVLAGVPCVEILQGLLALAHVGTERHWLTPMRKDVLEDAASQFVACTAGSSGMTRLETFPTHQAALSSASWRCRSRIRARRATSEREMPSMAACSSAHAYRSGLTRTAITGCSCASFSDIGVAFRSYKRCLSYKCILQRQSTERQENRNEKPRRGERRGSRGRAARFLSPEVLKPIRCQLAVTHRVLDVLVPEPGLQRPRVVPGIGQGIAAGVAQHVREDGEGHAGAPAEALKQRAEALGRHWAAALTGEHMRRCLLLPLQTPQRAYLVALHRVDTRCPALAPADVQTAGVELDLVPLQIA